MTPEFGNEGSPLNDQPNAESSAEKTFREFEQLVEDLSLPSYVFRLYVSGSTARSSVAVTSIRDICEKYLAGRYELEVVDVYQQPDETRKAQIIAVPTLIKELPFPPQRFVGDMSNTERILVGLKLKK